MRTLTHAPELLPFRMGRRFRAGRSLPAVECKHRLAILYQAVREAAPPGRRRAFALLGDESPPQQARARRQRLYCVIEPLAKYPHVAAICRASDISEERLALPRFRAEPRHPCALARSTACRDFFLVVGTPRRRENSTLRIHRLPMPGIQSAPLVLSAANPSISRNLASPTSCRMLEIV